MRAVIFAGDGRVRVDEVPPPTPEDEGDAVVSVSLASICASDLHLLDGKTPGMSVGSVIGHEFVGTVVESSGSAPSVGERVLGSFLIACGDCSACRREDFNFCKNRRALGLGALTGDLDGAQAEYVRVPNASLNLHLLNDPLAELGDEQLIFAGDVLATGFYAADIAALDERKIVVIIGAGPVGLCCAMAASLKRPKRLLVLDADPRRVEFAARFPQVEAVNVSEMDSQAAVAGATNGEMADVAIEAVGSIAAFKDSLKCVRDGGRIAVIGVYGAERYSFPMGMAWVRGLDVRFAGMANVQKHWDEALKAISTGAIDPTMMITHDLPLEAAEEGYELFASRRALKVVLRP
ncbi:MAG: alcohol dehydrogenase catalytic domain-containing protein [Actinomycetota bacterium]|nr:alcohol dehydrogenase catalytic domain-containing protein [Actinomycetota bacterium]